MFWSRKRFKLLDLAHGVDERVLVRIVPWQFQLRTVAGAGEYAGDEQEPLSERGRRVRLPILRQAEPLEPDHEVVGEQ